MVKHIPLPGFEPTPPLPPTEVKPEVIAAASGERALRAQAEADARRAKGVHAEIGYTSLGDEHEETSPDSSDEQVDINRRGKAAARLVLKSKRK